MAYIIEPIDEKFGIIELNTSSVVRLYKEEKEAHVIKRGLNLGHGFAGFTPDFFCIGVKELVDNENEAM